MVAEFRCQTRTPVGWRPPLKPLKSIALLTLLLPALVAAQGKTKKPYKLPAVFNQARYAYVEAVDGEQFDPRLYPEDRQAIANVQNALEDWNRYTLVTRRDEADLVFVVRKGRLADANVGVQVGTGTQGGPGTHPGGPSLGVGLGGEVGPPDDLLEIFVPNPSGVLGSPLWMRTLADGLNAPDVTMFRQFKDAVEHDYPVQTASQPKKP